jgi:hypothetical protein
VGESIISSEAAMGVIVPPKAFLRRRAPRAGATAAMPALAVVAVENVVYDEPLLSVTLVFNTTAEVPLVADPLDAEKWAGTYEGGAMTSYAADVVAFDRITVTLQGLPGAGGASTVSFAAAPSDVSDTSGRKLAAFGDLPL